MKGSYKVSGGIGPKCTAKIEWSISSSGRFSALGEVREGGQEYLAGQCLDEIKERFPDDELIGRIHKVWKKWHLNDMYYGSPDQEAYLAKLDYQGSGYFDWAKDKLADAGLEPDENFMFNNRPYSYGTARLYIPLPPEVEEEILSWPSQD